MTFTEYQNEAWKTALPTSRNRGYMAAEIASEGGEIIGKYAKFIRDGVWDVELVKKEIGDVLWGCAGLATVMGLSLELIAEGNITKLKDRQQRGVLQGNGDTR